MERIDITPKWVEILPILFEAIEHGDQNAKEFARKEFRRLAEAIDEVNEELKNGEE